MWVCPCRHYDKCLRLHTNTAPIFLHSTTVVHHSTTIFLAFCKNAVFTNHIHGWIYLQNRLEIWEFSLGLIPKAGVTYLEHLVGHLHQVPCTNALQCTNAPMHQCIAMQELVWPDILHAPMHQYRTPVINRSVFERF